MQKRNDRCPLCGATLHAPQLWAAREELLDEELGVHSAHCPFCQGYLEFRPRDDALDLGYLAPGPRFELALSLPCPGLRISQQGENWQITFPKPE